MHTRAAVIAPTLFICRIIISVDNGTVLQNSQGEFLVRRIVIHLIEIQIHFFYVNSQHCDFVVIAVIIEIADC